MSAFAVLKQTYNCRNAGLDLVSVDSDPLPSCRT